MISFIRKSFGRKVALAYVALFIIVFTVAAFYITTSLKKILSDQLKQSLEIEARLISNSLPPDFIRHNSREEIHKVIVQLGMQSQCRVTVVDTEGLVLGDSEESWEGLLKMDNHGQRSEIRSALGGNTGYNIRYSKTLQRYTLYLAMPLSSKGSIIGVLRLSRSLASVNEIFLTLERPVLVSCVIAVLITILIGMLFERSISKKIGTIANTAKRYAEGDLSHKILVDSDDELKVLAASLNQMAFALRMRIAQIESDKRQLAAILNHMTEGVIAVDNRRQVLIINPSAERIFNVSREKIIGRSLIEAIRNQYVDEMMTQAFQNQETVSCEIETLHPQKKLLRAHAIGISETEDSVSGILVFYDITEVRRLENVRKEFVANVSHELKTPLTSIKGFIETLLGGALKDQEQSKTFLKIMEEDTIRLTRLIEDILELSKIESKEVPIKLESVDLTSVIEQVLLTFKSQLGEKNIQIENQLVGRRSINVLADRDKLKQVLINLIDNAIKFNRVNGRLIINASKLDEKIRISIEDTGVGIAKEFIPRIFERFFRVDKARSRELGGTGLGLSIVKHIIESHGGEVACESKLDKGSVFSFTLKIVPSAL